MSLIWCDGFDHYGTSPSEGRTNMLAGPWAEVQSATTSQAPEISTVQARTGSYSLRFPCQNSTFTSTARRLFGANKTTIGLGFGLYMTGIPQINNRLGWQLRDDSNSSMLSFTLQSDASIEVRDGGTGGTSLGRTGQVLTAQAWNHVEFKVAFDDTNGSIEIRVNGVTVLDLSGLDLGTAGAAGIRWGKLGSTDGTEDFYIDDAFAWDDQGSANNDFLGSLGVFTLLPNQDTVQADWAVTGAGTGWEALDDVPPDGDTSYIAADTVNDASEFELDDFPEGISEVAALVAVGYMRKTDAGDGNVQMGLVSSAVGSPPMAAVANGADRPITEVYTYWQDVIENDPATGAPWEASAVNDVKLRLNRTA